MQTARTHTAMAAYKALPRVFGDVTVHRRVPDPRKVSTWAMGICRSRSSDLFSPGCGVGALCSKT